MADAQSILTPLKIPENIKADAFDAYHAAKSSGDLATALRKIPLDESVRADLWDLKNAEGGGVAAAAPAAPAAGGFFHNAGQVLAGINDTANPLGMLYDVAVQPSVDLYKSIHDGNGGGALDAFGRMINPGGALASKAMGAQIDQGKQAVTDIKAGRYVEGILGHGLAAITPLVGPAAAQAGELIGDGQTYRGIGQGLGLVGQVLAPKAIKAGVDRAGWSVPTADQVIPGLRDAVKPSAIVNRMVANQSPRPLSAGASALADELNIPRTAGMQGGSKTVQAMEKMLGHSVAADMYEPLLEKAREGVDAGARKLAEGYATDKFTAGQTVIDGMLDAAKPHFDAAKVDYAAMAEHENNPDNVRTVKVGMKENPSTDPGAPAMIPDMKPLPVPVDWTSTKAAVKPFVAELKRAMTPAARNMDPGLTILENVLERPDATAASTAELDLGYMKEVMRDTNTSPRAKFLVGKAIEALTPAIDAGVAIAGPDAVESLHSGRSNWAAGSSIHDDLHGLTGGDLTGRTGQVMTAEKLLQRGDRNYPMLDRVLSILPPEAAHDLGQSFLTSDVFKKAAQEGESFSNPTTAKNIINQLGPRTRSRIYTPEKMQDWNNLVEIAKRVGENPNPSGTGTMNTLLKLGVMVAHPIAGVATFVLGRSAAKLLYFPKGIQTLETALGSPKSAAGMQAAAAVTKMMAEPPPVPPPALPVTIPTNATTNSTNQPAGGSAGPVDPGPAQPRPTLPEPAQAGLQASPGSSQTVVTVPGETRKYSGEYQLKELSDVRASHNAFNFQPNPKYGLLNDRNYDNPVNQGKIVNWSVPGPGGFDPSELVNDARNSSTGPPVLDQSGNILGGNGRGMIMNRVYKSNPAGASAYRDLLAQKAAQFGIDPAAVATMKQPVLTRVLHDSEFAAPGSKQGAVTDFNKSGTAALTPNERAIADSRRVSTSTLDDISKRLDAAGDTSTLRKVLEGHSGVEVLNNLIADGVVSPQERADLATQHQLTKGGTERIEALMTGRFFGTVSQMDQVPAMIRGKVERMAAPLAHVEGVKDFNLSPRLQEAMTILEDAAGHGHLTVDDYISQQGMFADQNFSRGAVALAKQLIDRDPTKLQAAARGYAADAKYASEHQGPGMFGDIPDPLTPAAAFEKHFGPAALESEAAAKASAKEAAATRKSQNGQPK